jgi:hypothetical protein
MTAAGVRLPQAHHVADPQFERPVRHDRSPLAARGIRLAGRPAPPYIKPGNFKPPVSADILSSASAVAFAIAS